MKMRGQALVARSKMSLFLSQKLFLTLTTNKKLSLLFVVYIFYFFARSKDYTVPVSFVSAGLRKTAAEEKQQEKEGDSDDSDDDSAAPPPPPPSRVTAPKKLQMVILFPFKCFPLLCNSSKDIIETRI